MLSCLVAAWFCLTVLDSFTGLSDSQLVPRLDWIFFLIYKFIHGGFRVLGSQWT